MLMNGFVLMALSFAQHSEIHFEITTCIPFSGIPPVNKEGMKLCLFCKRNTGSNTTPFNLPTKDVSNTYANLASNVNNLVPLANDMFDEQCIILVSIVTLSDSNSCCFIPLI